MRKKQFKAESKKLLDMMIHSIYTNKDIFLRELISNASDAIDKLYFQSLTDRTVGISKGDFEIRITSDPDARILTVSDNGIGMTEAELESNLGTIAQSGSLGFKNDNQQAKENDIEVIGQFGVGFYSAFMVADRVEVVSRAFGADAAFKWSSAGVDGYTVEPCEKDTAGTVITLHIKPDAEGEDFSRYLDPYTLSGLVKKYSDYIRYPIKMEMPHTEPDPDKEGEYKETRTLDTLNSMVPLWRKNKSELDRDAYNAFYKSKFGDFEDPLWVIHTKTEGQATFDALLFFPARPPFDFYTKGYEKGLQLYSNGVLIMEKCGDLLSDAFSFVKGVVDSADLSLNISREVLQQDHQLKIIAKAIDKKIKSELKKLLQNERETYEKLFATFGTQLKWGVYANYGADKDGLKDLLLFSSAKQGKPLTLREYVDGMPEGQKAIYYACGESAEKIALLPQVESVTAKGYDLLYFTDDVDEFAIQMLQNYDGKPFANICKDDLQLESEDEKKELQAKNESEKSLLDEMKSILGDAVTAVRFSNALGSHAVGLSAEGYVSLEMAKVLRQMPGGDGAMQAQLVLELNPNHKVADTLSALLATDHDKLSRYTTLLYNQARLIGGLDLENPTAFADMVTDLML